MKKILFLTIFTSSLFIPLALFSQQQEPAESVSSSKDAKRKVVPGIKVGITRTDVYDRTGEAFVSRGRNGYGAGVCLALPLGSLLGIQPELLLLQKGFQGVGSIGGEKYIINRTTTHLDIPVQLQFKPFKWLTFLGGPQWSFVLNKTDSYSEGNNTTARTQIESSDNRSSLAGTLIGLDLNFRHVVLGVRSGWDLSSNNGDGTSLAPRYRNKWMFWSLGYRFY